MNTTEIAAIAGHDRHCLQSALLDAAENAEDAGQDLTTAQLAEIAAENLISGLSSCTCKNEANGWGPASPNCLCGCGQTARRNYLPGHDARHLAYVVASYKESLEYGYSALTLAEHLSALPTEALVRKALARIAR